MYKLITFVALLAVAAAAPGLIGSYAAPISPWGNAPLAAPWGHAAPLASPWGHGLVGAPLVGAPVVKTAVPVATSYANTVRIASPVVAAPAPLVAHAPVAYASPYGQYGHPW